MKELLRSRMMIWCLGCLTEWFYLSIFREDIVKYIDTDYGDLYRIDTGNWKLLMQVCSQTFCYADSFIW